MYVYTHPYMAADIGPLHAPIACENVSNRLTEN